MIDLVGLSLFRLVDLGICFQHLLPEVSLNMGQSQSTGHVAAKTSPQRFVKQFPKQLDKALYHGVVFHLSMHTNETHVFFRYRIFPQLVESE